jgi:hypothetical protein
MSEPILWMTDSANFVKGDTFDTGRKVKNPNAQVAAITIFENAVTGEARTYRDGFFDLTHAMEEWALRPGRASARRSFFRESIRDDQNWSLHRYRMPMEFIKERMKGLPVEWATMNFVGSTTKLHLDNRVFEEDKIILARLSSDEVVPVIGGVAYYPWNPNIRAGVGRSRMVYGYWTTS